MTINTEATSATPRGRTPVTPCSPPHTHSGSRPMRVDTQASTRAGCTPVCARSLRHAGAPHAVTFTNGQSRAQSASRPRSEPHVLTHVRLSLVRRAHPGPRQPRPSQGARPHTDRRRLSHIPAGTPICYRGQKLGQDRAGGHVTPSVAQKPCRVPRTVRVQGGFQGCSWTLSQERITIVAIFSELVGSSFRGHRKGAGGPRRQRGERVSSPGGRGRRASVMQVQSWGLARRGLSPLLW